MSLFVDPRGFLFVTSAAYLTFSHTARLINIHFQGGDDREMIIKVPDELMAKMITEFLKNRVFGLH